jgi:opacity protein-like surface antigen
MRHYSDLFLRRLQEVTRVLLAYGLFALLGSAPAVAEDFSAGQPYFSLSGMVAGADGATISSAGGTADPAFNFSDPLLQTKIGFGVVGAFGWLTNNNWRMEIELGYRQVALESIASPARATLDGDLSITTGFVNVLRDFRGESFITPYIGIGVGGAYHKLDVGSINDASPDFGSQDTFSLVYQAMLGVSFEVGENMDILAGYRFMGAWEPDYDAFALDRLDIHHFEMGVKFYIGD